MLLYEYCVENDYVKKRDDLFYDRILFKFIIYSTFTNNNCDTELNKNVSLANQPSIQAIVDELVDFIRVDLFNEPKTTNTDSLNEKSSISNLGSSATSLSSSNSETKFIYDFNELSSNTSEYLKNLLTSNPTRAKVLFELILKYSPNSEHIFLKVHISAVYKVLDEIETGVNRKRSFISEDLKEPTDSKQILYSLLNYLSIYKINTNTQQLQQTQQQQIIQSKIENVKYESLAILQRCFKDLCYKFNSLWSENLDELDENIRNVYSCFLFDKEEDDVDENSNKSKINLLNLFSKIHYEVERQITISNTFHDDSIPILSLIKQYSNATKKDVYLWRRFFLYCYIENKVLLKSLIVSLRLLKNMILMF